MYLYIKIKRRAAPVWVHLHRRTDVNIGRCRRAGDRLCYHSTARCKKGHLNSGAVVTLAWQYSSWGISTDHRVALEGCTATARLSSDLPRHITLQRSPVFTFSNSGIEMLSLVSCFCSRRALLYSLNWMQ